MGANDITGARLRVSHVTIRNILGIEELEFTPGGFTEVSGANGSGKTSTIEALRAALRGGHDATLLRNGTEKGEIVLVLDDGTQIRKKVTPSDTDVTILRDEKKLSRPAEAIKRLHDALSVNPVEFLRAPEKSRVDALLQVMPIALDMGRVTEITGQGAIDGALREAQRVAKGSDKVPEGLDLLEAVKRFVFDDRTGINRAARDKEGTINQLRATLPEEAAEAPPTDATLLAKLNEIDAERDAELERISTKLAGLKAESDERVEALRASIRELERQIDAERADFNEKKSLAAQTEAEVRAEHAEKRAGVEAQVKQIEKAQQAAARFAQTRETIARMVADLEELKADSQARTDALEALDAYKAELLASLPIPGLEVIEGKLLRYGVPFERLNEAQKVRIAIEIARLRAGELGLICVDGLELLDPEAYDAFRKDAEEFGLQLIVSKVSEGPLTITGAA
jgi:DNA repair exonuclease SbcCD ATPase subunit